MSRWTARRIAGIAYLVPVATIGAIAWMLLSLARAQVVGLGAASADLLLRDAQRAIYVWLLALAAACVVLAARHLRAAAPPPRAALAECIAGIALAAAAWATLDDSIAAVVTLPLAASLPDLLHRWLRRGRVAHAANIGPA